NCRSCCSTQPTTELSPLSLHAALPISGYKQTISNALEEVENRIVQYSQIQQQLQLLVQAEALAHQATTLARTRHENGLIAYFERSEEHTSELQSRENLVCRLLLEKKKK